MYRLIYTLASFLILLFASCIKSDNAEVVATPQMGATTVDSVTSFSAVATSTVISDGGSGIVERGFVYSMNNNFPIVGDDNVIASPATGVYTCKITGLLNNTTYYLRAYSINSSGINYGANRIIFKTTFAIGQSYQGGILFYIDNLHQHGLIAAPVDQGNATWGCNGTGISIADSTGVGYGQPNTTAIITTCTSTGIAASICNNLKLNGYNSDWYLPSLGELQLLYNERNAVGGFIAGSYWSSSESDPSNAYFVNFTNGTDSSSSKNSPYNVRAIRAF